MWASRREGHAPGQGRNRGTFSTVGHPGALARWPGVSRICSLGITVTDKIAIAVTFNPDCGYVGTSPELRAPIVALSLGGLRRKIQALISPDEVIVTLNKAARLEREAPRSASSGLRRYGGLMAGS